MLVSFINLKEFFLLYQQRIKSADEYSPHNQKKKDNMFKQLDKKHQRMVTYLELPGMELEVVKNDDQPPDLCFEPYVNRIITTIEKIPKEYVCKVLMQLSEKASKKANELQQKEKS